MIRRGKLAMLIGESIRTMPATLFATIATPQKIATRKDHQPIFEVIVLILFERFWLLSYNHFVLCASSWLKHKACTGAARSSRRSKAALKIVPIEEIVDVAEETQLPPVVTQWQRIARAEIGLR